MPAEDKGAGNGGAGALTVGDLDAAARGLAGAAARAGDIESMSVADMVAAYYKALSVRAHMEAARAEGGNGGGSAGAVAAADAALEAFDARFHPRAMARLESVSAGLAERLEREDGDGGSGGDEDEFDRLRAAMSAAEFARQYDRGLRGG